MHAPTQWCIAIGSLQNPTSLGRAWKPAPTGFVRCRSCCAKSDPTRARNARPYGIVCIRFLQNKIPRQTEKYCLSGGKCISVNRVNRRKDRRDRFAVSSGVRPKPVQISLCPFHSPCRVRAWLQSRYPPYACRHFLFRPLCR